VDVPEWVMLRRAPVALRWTRISFERARRVRGPNAVDLAILFLFSSRCKNWNWERWGRNRELRGW
jgi:hypothetical protein